MNMTQILLSEYSLTEELEIPNTDLDWSWAKELTFQIYVSALTGAPAAAKLEVSWELLIPNTTVYQQFASPVWVPAEAGQLVSLIADGSDFPSPLCTEVTSLPVVYQRTIKHFGYAARLKMTPTFTGGTTPGWTVSANLIAKD